MTKKSVLQKGKDRTMYGLLLWFLVLFGDFLFIFNWLFITNLTGSVEAGNGWVDAFFNKEPSLLTTQAVNYTISLMRGIGTLMVGFFLAKFGHKYSVLIGMGLLSLGLPTIAAGYWNSTGGYVVFLIGRMLMAIGGTTLLVYTQPIISKFFNHKGKSILTRFNQSAYNLGTALPLILFAFPTIRDSILDDWMIWSFIISGIPVILLIVYWIVAQDINIVDKAKGYEQGHELKPSTWKSVAKEKDVWVVACIGAVWTFAVTAIVTIAPKWLPDLHAERFDPLETWEVQLPIILFLFGLFPAMYVINWILATNYDRRFYAMLILVLGILCVIAGTLCTVYINNIAPSCIFMFLGGIFLFGSQPLFFNHPHEMEGNSPQRVGIIISFYVGISFFLTFFFTIIVSAIYDALYTSSGLEVAAWVQFGIYMAISASAIILWRFVKKTKHEKLSKAIGQKVKKVFSKSTN